ncbi:MAG: right-handed parallel beta-helix repeat-containing protein [Clostridia bacterium]|nr:right-handed parallel beta-helix repeat-containing protein [Clostridia bacterium]
MKKLTKILLLVMLAALAVSAFAFSAFAEEVDNTVYTYGGFTVNGTAYPPSNEEGKTLADVILAATEAVNVTLNNNITVSQNIDPKYNVTIDLNGKTLDSTAAILFQYVSGVSTKNLTFKIVGTGTINCADQLTVNGGSRKFYVTGTSATDRITINANSTELVKGNTINSVSGTVELKNVDVVIATNLADSNTNASIFYNNKTRFTFDGCNVTSSNSTAVTDKSYIFTAATTDGTETSPHLYTFKNSTLDAVGSASRGFNVGATASLVISGSTVNMPVGVRMESKALSVEVSNGSVLTSTSSIPLWLGGYKVVIDSSTVTSSSSGALYLVDNAAISDDVTVTNSRFENTTSGYAVGIGTGDVSDITQNFIGCQFISNSQYAILHQSSSTLELQNCMIKSKSSYAINAQNAAIATLKNCEINSANNSAFYMTGKSSVALDNCYINASTAFNLQSEGTTTLKETFVNATGHAFYIMNTAGITVDGCVVYSASSEDNSSSTFFFSADAASNILLDNDAKIIDAKNSTFSSKGGSADGSQTSAGHFLILNDAITTGEISGTISFDNCNISFQYRCIATNFATDHLTADARLTFRINDTTISQVSDGALQGFFRGNGILMYFTGNSKIVHAHSNPTLSTGATPKAGTMNFAEGTRLSFIPASGDVGFTPADGCSVVYDPFGDSEAPYVVTKTAGVSGFVNDKVASVLLGTSFGSYNSGNYTSNVNMQIGFQHSEGSSMLANYEKNGNTFVKYTLPTASNSNVTVDEQAGTVNFVGTTDFFVMGSGTVAKSAVADFTVTHSDSTTYDAVAKKVIVMQMNFTAGSDTGYVPFNLQFAARGGSINNENSISTGSSFLGSDNLISISGDYSFKAPDGNTYTLNGLHEWNNLYVVVDVANNKLHAYVNGTCITGEGITAFKTGAEYVQGFRINLKGKTVNESTDTIAFDAFAAVTYDEYISGGKFVLQDYVKISDAYKTLAPTTENIIAMGHAFGTVDSALSAVKGTDYTVRLLGDVNEAQTVGTSGTVITLDNKLNLANDNTERFIKYTKTTTGAFGDIYTFAYNKSLGTTVNLSLFSGFDINLFIPEALVPYVEKIAVGETDITADAYEFDGKLVASVGRAADEANDSVIFKVTFVENGKSYTYSFTVSIVAYTEKLLADYSETNVNMDHVLMYHILKYANEANIYFDKNEALAQRVADLAALGEGEYKEAVGDATADAVDTLDKTLFEGVTVVLDETPSLRLELKAQTNAKITASYTDVKTGAKRYADVNVNGVNVDFDGIKIYNLAQALTVYVDGVSVGEFNIGVYDVDASADHYALVNAFCEYISLAKYLYKAQ